MTQRALSTVVVVICASSALGATELTEPVSAVEAFSARYKEFRWKPAATSPGLRDALEAASKGRTPERVDAFLKEESRQNLIKAFRATPPEGHQSLAEDAVRLGLYEAPPPGADECQQRAGAFLLRLLDEGRCAVAITKTFPPEVLSSEERDEALGALARTRNPSSQPLIENVSKVRLRWWAQEQWLTLGCLQGDDDEWEAEVTVASFPPPEPSVVIPNLVKVCESMEMEAAHERRMRERRKGSGER